VTTDHLYDPIGDVIRDDIPREVQVPLTDLERLAIADSKSAAEVELEALRRQYLDRAKEIGRRIAELGGQLRERKQRRVIPATSGGSAARSWSSAATSIRATRTR